MYSCHDMKRQATEWSLVLIGYYWKGGYLEEVKCHFWSHAVLKTMNFFSGFLWSTSYPRPLNLERNAFYIVIVVVVAQNMSIAVCLYTGDFRETSKLNTETRRCWFEQSCPYRTYVRTIRGFGFGVKIGLLSTTISWLSGNAARWFLACPPFSHW